MKTSLVLGFFDGVHLGHQSVINLALASANIENLDTRLITFKQSPSMFFCNNVEYILSREESIKKIKSFGITEVIELDFSKFVSLSPFEYLEYITKKFNPAFITTGFNHTFGAKKAGNSKLLEDYQTIFGYKYNCAEPQYYNGEIISSTKIRSLLKDGSIEAANLLLNSNFSIEGVVKTGAQIGQTIGFPTANIIYPEEIVKIPYGVYAAKLDSMPAVLNWGMRPTVNNAIEPIVEAHVLNFNGNLYGKKVKIEILSKIRNEKKFATLVDLKEQIKKDIDECLKLL